MWQKVSERKKKHFEQMVKVYGSDDDVLVISITIDRSIASLNTFFVVKVSRDQHVDGLWHVIRYGISCISIPVFRMVLAPARR